MLSSFPRRHSLRINTFFKLLAAVPPSSIHLNFFLYMKKRKTQQPSATLPPLHHGQLDACEPLALYCPHSMTLVWPEERNIALIHSAHTEKPNSVTQAGAHCCVWYKMYCTNEILLLCSQKVQFICIPQALKVDLCLLLFCLQSTFWQSIAFSVRRSWLNTKELLKQ